MDNKCVEKLLETVAFSNGCICSVELIRWEHTHFHPSGSLKASKEDMRITKKLSIACQLIGIDFLDHIIVGGMDDMVSLREERTYLFKSSQDEIEKLFVAENRDSLT